VWYGHYCLGGWKQGVLHFIEVYLAEDGELSESVFLEADPLAHSILCIRPGVQLGSVGADCNNVAGASPPTPP